MLNQLTALAKEHMLGPAEANTLRAEQPRPHCVLRGVGVGAHPKLSDLVGILKEAINTGDNRSIIFTQRRQDGVNPVEQVADNR